MRSQIETAVARSEPPGALEAAMDRLFGEGVRPLRLEDAVFAAMLDGWDRQQRSRMLRPATISAGVRLVRRVRASADRWPWEWTAADLEDFISDLASAPLYRRPATLRNYQSQLRGFLDYLVDERYPWRLVCTGCFGRPPVQLLEEYNTIVHVGEHESDPRRRALTRDELQTLFDQCDRRVAGRRALQRKGSLAALRDGAMFKVCYGWGLRRTELIGLDVCDLLTNPQQPRFGGCGLRDRPCPSWEGLAGQRSEAPGRADGLVVGGRGARAVRERDPAAVRL